MNLHTRSIKVLFLVIFFFCLFSIYTAKANSLGLVSEKINEFIKFIDSSITEDLRKDFCIQYFSAVSSGEWKADEFRVKFGNKVCVGKEKEYLVLSLKDKVEINTATTSVVTKKGKVENNDLLLEPLVDNKLEDDLILIDSQIIYWTNIERSKNTTGLVQLKENKELAKIAKERVEDMFEKTYFEHISPVGDSVSKIAEKNIYKYIIIGENIALGNFGGSREVVKAWMNSEGHKANILNKNYTEIGVYSKEGKYDGRKVWISAQVFAKPLSSCSEPDNLKKENIEKINISLNIVKKDIKNAEDELKKVNISDIKTYNEKVSNYNNLAHIFNGLIADIENITTLYNKEVTNFNKCIKIN